MNTQTIRQAFYKSIPVLAGYVVIGMGFGILMRNAGYGTAWAAAMSIFMYAGSMQYVGVGLLTGGASVLTTAITTFMVNARHLFYSISMINTYKDAGKYKPFMIFALTDETYSLLCDGKVPAGVEPERYRFFVSFFNYCYWVAGSILGNLLGAVLPFSNHVPALTGLLCTLLSLAVFGRENFLIPAMLLITLALSLLRRDGEETL